MDYNEIIRFLGDPTIDQKTKKVICCSLFESIAEVQDGNIQNTLLKELIANYVILEKKVDSLLKNTLPEKVAEEIKINGSYQPREFECTILFTDFSGFTALAEKNEAKRLIEILHQVFSGFDKIINENEGVKIKTIGDAYMSAFGVLDSCNNHAFNAVTAALKLKIFLDDFNQKHALNLQMRTGIHTGKVFAGVVGTDRMQFDVFGDNVNIAARFESSGEIDQINISHKTYKRIQSDFKFTERGFIKLKNKDDMRAYFVHQS